MVHLGVIGAGHHLVGHARALGRVGAVADAGVRRVHPVLAVLGADAQLALEHGAGAVGHVEAVGRAVLAPPGLGLTGRRGGGSGSGKRIERRRVHDRLQRLLRLEVSGRAHVDLRLAADGVQVRLVLGVGALAVGVVAGGGAVADAVAGRPRGVRIQGLQLGVGIDGHVVVAHVGVAAEELAVDTTPRSAGIAAAPAAPAVGLAHMHDVVGVAIAVVVVRLGVVGVGGVVHIRRVDTVAEQVHIGVLPHGEVRFNGLELHLEPVGVAAEPAVAGRDVDVLPIPLAAAVLAHPLRLDLLPGPRGGDRLAARVGDGAGVHDAVRVGVRVRMIPRGHLAAGGVLGVGRYRLDGHRLDLRVLDEARRKREIARVVAEVLVQRLAGLLPRRMSVAGVGPGGVVPARGQVADGELGAMAHGMVRIVGDHGAVTGVLLVAVGDGLVVAHLGGGDRILLVVVPVEVVALAIGARVVERRLVHVHRVDAAVGAGVARRDGSVLLARVLNIGLMAVGAHVHGRADGSQRGGDAAGARPGTRPLLDGLLGLEGGVHLEVADVGGFAAQLHVGVGGLVHPVVEGAVVEVDLHQVALIPQAPVEHVVALAVHGDDRSAGIIGLAVEGGQRHRGGRREGAFGITLIAAHALGRQRDALLVGVLHQPVQVDGFQRRLVGVRQIVVPQARVDHLAGVVGLRLVRAHLGTAEQLAGQRDLMGLEVDELLHGVLRGVRARGIQHVGRNSVHGEVGAQVDGVLRVVGQIDAIARVVVVVVGLAGGHVVRTGGPHRRVGTGLRLDAHAGAVAQKRAGVALAARQVIEVIVLLGIAAHVGEGLHDGGAVGRVRGAVEHAQGVDGAVPLRVRVVRGEHAAEPHGVLVGDGAEDVQVAAVVQREPAAEVGEGLLHAAQVVGVLPHVAVGQRHHDAPVGLHRDAVVGRNGRIFSEHLAEQRAAVGVVGRGGHEGVLLLLGVEVLVREPGERRAEGEAGDDHGGAARSGGVLHLHGGAVGGREHVQAQIGRDAALAHLARRRHGAGAVLRVVVVGGALIGHVHRGVAFHPQRRRDRDGRGLEVGLRAALVVDLGGLLHRTGAGGGVDVVLGAQARIAVRVALGGVVALRHPDLRDLVGGIHRLAGALGLLQHHAGLDDRVPDIEGGIVAHGDAPAAARVADVALEELVGAGVVLLHHRLHRGIGGLGLGVVHQLEVDELVAILGALVGAVAVKDALLGVALQGEDVAHRLRALFLHRLRVDEPSVVGDVADRALPVGVLVEGVAAHGYRIARAREGSVLGAGLRDRAATFQGFAVLVGEEAVGDVALVALAVDIKVVASAVGTLLMGHRQRRSVGEYEVVAVHVALVARAVHIDHVAVVIEDIGGVTLAVGGRLGGEQHAVHIGVGRRLEEEVLLNLLGDIHLVGERGAGQGAAMALGIQVGRGGRDALHLAHVEGLGLLLVVGVHIKEVRAVEHALDGLAVAVQREDGGGVEGLAALDAIRRAVLEGAVLDDAAIARSVGVVDVAVVVAGVFQVRHKGVRVAGHLALAHAGGGHLQLVGGLAGGERRRGAGRHVAAGKGRREVLVGGAEGAGHLHGVQLLGGALHFHVHLGTGGNRLLAAHFLEGDGHGDEVTGVQPVLRRDDDAVLLPGALVLLVRDDVALGIKVQARGRVLLPHALAAHNVGLMALKQVLERISRKLRLLGLQSRGRPGRAHAVVDGDAIDDGVVDEILADADALGGEALGVLRAVGVAHGEGGRLHDGDGAVVQLEAPAGARTVQDGLTVRVGGGVADGGRGIEQVHRHGHGRGAHLRVGARGRVEGGLGALGALQRRGVVVGGVVPHALAVIHLGGILVVGQRNGHGAVDTHGDRQGLVLVNRRVHHHANVAGEVVDRLILVQLGLGDAGQRAAVTRLDERCQARVLRGAAQAVDMLVGGNGAVGRLHLVGAHVLGRAEVDPVVDVLVVALGRRHDLELRDGAGSAVLGEAFLERIQVVVEIGVDLQRAVRVLSRLLARIGVEPLVEGRILVALGQRILVLDDELQVVQAEVVRQRVHNDGARRRGGGVLAVQGHIAHGLHVADLVGDHLTQVAEAGVLGLHRGRALDDVRGGTPVGTNLVLVLLEGHLLAGHGRLGKPEGIGELRDGVRPRVVAAHAQLAEEDGGQRIEVNIVAVALEAHRLINISSVGHRDDEAVLAVAVAFDLLVRVQVTAVFAGDGEVHAAGLVVGLVRDGLRVNDRRAGVLIISGLDLVVVIIGSVVADGAGVEHLARLRAGTASRGTALSAAAFRGAALGRRARCVLVGLVVDHGTVVGAFHNGVDVAEVAHIERLVVFGQPVGRVVNEHAALVRNAHVGDLSRCAARGARGIRAIDPLGVEDVVAIGELELVPGFERLADAVGLGAPPGELLALLHETAFGDRDLAALGAHGLAHGARAAVGVVGEVVGQGIRRMIVFRIERVGVDGGTIGHELHEVLLGDALGVVLLGVVHREEVLQVVDLGRAGGGVLGGHLVHHIVVAIEQNVVVLVARVVLGAEVDVGQRLIGRLPGEVRLQQGDLADGVVVGLPLGSRQRGTHAAKRVVVEVHTGLGIGEHVGRAAVGDGAAGVLGNVAEHGHRAVRREGILAGHLHVHRVAGGVALLLSTVPLEDELAGEARAQIEALEVLLGLRPSLVDEALENLWGTMALRQILIQADLLLTVSVGDF